MKSAMCEVKIGDKWLDQGGRPTDSWTKRGLWPTAEEADKVRRAYFLSDDFWGGHKASVAQPGRAGSL